MTHSIFQDNISIPETNAGLFRTHQSLLILSEYDHGQNDCTTDSADHHRKEKGLKTVLVSNGMAQVDTVKELFKYVDAMNIDLKGFTDHYYEDVLHGNRKMVMDFISEATKHCHLELTTLIIPGENDSDEEMDELSAWIASLNKDIPLHISRFFPRFHMLDKEATPVETIYHSKTIAEKHLTYVYTGNCR